MPSTAIKLIPGVNTDKTPSLNEAGISSSNLIRFREGLVEKRGGWSQFLSEALSGVPRALWPWRDFGATNWVAIGTTQGLFVATNGIVEDISPRVLTSLIPYNDVIATQGQLYLKLNDPNYTLSQGTYGLVIVDDLFSISNKIISGTYNLTSIVYDNNTQQSQTGNFLLLNNGDSVFPYSASQANFPSYSTVSGSNIVTVYLLFSGARVGQKIYIPKPIFVGGLKLQGIYSVYQNVYDFNQLDESRFTIRSNQPAVTTDSFTVSSTTITLRYQISQNADEVPPGTPVGASDWSLGNYGEILIACAVGGSVYQWQSDGVLPSAAPIPNAPQASGIVIADAAQQIIAYGGAAYTVYDPNYVAWCDTANPTVWTAAIGNQAGSYRIPSGSGIVGAATVASTLILLWTDVDVWTMQYVSYPLIYGFNKVATGCGLVAQFAWARMGSLTYWMSQNKFWVFDGQGVQPLDCPVYDSVFPLISKANAWKIRGGSNAAFGEVMWFFPSAAGAGENDSYVCFNPAENTWDVGAMARSAWVDQSVAGLPIGADPSGNVYQHETSPDAAGAAMVWSFTTGLFQISEGEDMAFIDRLRPDFKFPQGSGTIQVSVLTYKYPGDAPVVRGPYSFTAATEYISIRCRGRYIALQFSGSDLGSFWRIGRTQFRFQPDGRR